MAFLTGFRAKFGRKLRDFVEFVSAFVFWAAIFVLPKEKAIPLILTIGAKTEDRHFQYPELGPWLALKR